MFNFDKFKDKIIYSYSTRRGGVSTGVYESMDLSFSMGDDPKHVRRNFDLWCGGLGTEVENIVMVHQTHTANVMAVSGEMRGQGVIRPREFRDVDAMITNEKGVALVTSHADCVPVYLYDPVKEAIGMVHAGWRGTVGEIAGNAVRKMGAEYGCDPADMYAMVGPCISQKRFECDRNVIDAVDAMSVDAGSMYYLDGESGKYHASLAGINRIVLMDAGIDESHIDMNDVCTYDNEDLYFSHRRQGPARGSQAAMLQLK